MHNSFISFLLQVHEWCAHGKALLQTVESARSQRVHSDACTTGATGAGHTEATSADELTAHLRERGSLGLCCPRLFRKQFHAVLTPTFSVCFFLSFDASALPILHSETQTHVSGCH